MSRGPRQEWVLPLARVLAAAGGVAVLVLGASSTSSASHPMLQRHTVREVQIDLAQQLRVQELLQKDGAVTQAAPGTARPEEDPAPHVRPEEKVRITGPTGKSVEVLARIDTGAKGSSMDDDLAEELEFDLENAEKIRVTSSLGTEERPVVTGQLLIAGQDKKTRFSVTDREERSAPVLIGRRDLAGVHVVIGEEE
ncbi:MAG: RimK/LysX family protein [Actinomycetota bacterium]|nr:RimK/LysX family protein [Actinomycetota bacterium]